MSNPGTLPKYRCTVCGREDVGPDDLVRKVVSFKEMGSYGSTLKSVTTEWICVIPNGHRSACIDQDAEWQLEPRKGRPGNLRAGT